MGGPKFIARVQETSSKMTSTSLAKEEEEVVVAGIGGFHIAANIGFYSSSDWCGVYKLNCDGSVEKHLNKAAVGGILRNDSGHVVFAFSA
ncbi:hypothetical protein JHK84_037365 [Glycine max]|nr:hypothetical protein JHK86_037164 [Glycine max]KAG5130968.1 hypothetical protein JHK84_037365 [Glycine max]